MSISDKVLQLKTDFDEVYEAGKDLEREEFWSNFWNSIDGYYSYRFCGCGWTEDSFKPIYPNGIIQPTSAEKMFNFFNRNRSYNNPLVDMTEFCRHFDFSKATNVANIFDNARAKNITLDFSSATNLTGAFNSGNGGKFENIKLKVTENCTKFTSCFAYFRRQNPTTIMLTEDSVVAADIGCDSQRLNKESIKRFVNALSPTTTDKVLTLHKKAVDAAFETSTGANDGENSEEWANLIATKSNWTITLTTAT